MNVRRAFQMPSTAMPKAISGRSSSITAAFISSILPVINPTDEEIEAALKILGMTADDVRCAYCGDKSSEWDHLRPIVTEQKPTGFISEIRNLVPSCGKCNQSKGKTYWRTWVLGSAKLSPTTRRVENLEQRIERLEQYEKWGNLNPINFESLVPSDMWQQHWENWQRVVEDLKRSQKNALRVRQYIEKAIKSASAS